MAHGARIDIMFDVIIGTTGMVTVATLFGSMAFFTAVVAPFVLTQLEAATAGRFIRGIFPWYYAVIIALATLAAASLTASDPWTASIMAAVAAGAVVSRQLLMPRINHLRDLSLQGDAGAGRRFNRLHRASVWINTLQLVATLAVLVRLALP